MGRQSTGGFDPTRQTIVWLNSVRDQMALDIAFGGRMSRSSSPLFKKPGNRPVKQIDSDIPEFLVGESKMNTTRKDACAKLDLHKTFRYNSDVTRPRRDSGLLENELAHQSRSLSRLDKERIE